MGLIEFNFAPLDQRFEAVLERGTFLAFREDDAYRVNLYDMGRFYAEIWFKPGETQVRLVLGFTSIECLNPYLVKINLKELMNNSPNLDII